MNRTFLYVLVFLTLLLRPLFASVIHDGAVEDLEYQMGTLSIAAPSQATHHEVSPFDWQNSKHFDMLTRRFELLAERELPHIIMQLIKAINSHDTFFEDRYQNVLHMNKKRVVGWMNEDVLTESNFHEDSTPYSAFGHDENETTDSDEDPIAAGIRRGYEGETDSESERDSDTGSDSGSDPASGDALSEEADFDPYDDYDWDNPWEDERQRRVYDENFEEWKVQKIKDVLGLDLSHSDDLEEDKIDVPQIKRFLEHVNFGRERGYSWLLNEDIEGSLFTSEDFVDSVYKKMGMEKEILSNLLCGLWFDFDWEEFGIDDPRFIQKTYTKTLEDLLQGTRAKSVKKYTLERIKQLFTFHGDDFEAPFKEIPERFNGFVRERKWLHAMIEWSLYSTYRKVFATPAKRSKITTLETVRPATPIIHAFNREAYLTTRMSKALRRVQKYYTKVYPREETSKIVFGPPHPERAELNMAEEFRILKRVGKAYERARPPSAEAANVFVPMLYFITSRAAIDHHGGDNPKRFVRVPLVLSAEKHAVTRQENTLVFKGTHANDNYYFDQAKKDVVRGKVLQGGVSENEASEEISEIIKNAGVNRNTLLVHSERVLIEALRDEAYVTQIVGAFAQKMQETGAGTYGVYGAVMLAYSTNTVCSYCTSSLVALQNSGEEEGGFLRLLVGKLVDQNSKGVLFDVSGYNPQARSMDWRQFCLNTFVTARINFDEQAHDLTEAGQFLSKKVKRPSQEKHNPHAKLFFPNNEIDVEPVQGDGEHSHISYIYEFVGKDMHAEPHANDNGLSVVEHQGTVFASGSTSWMMKSPA